MIVFAVSFPDPRKAISGGSAPCSLWAVSYSGGAVYPQIAHNVVEYGCPIPLWITRVTKALTLRRALQREQLLPTLTELTGVTKALTLRRDLQRIVKRRIFPSCWSHKGTNAQASFATGSAEFKFSRIHMSQRH